MQQIPVSANRREGSGKGRARAIRRSGQIPAVLYGQGEDVLSIRLDSHTFEHLVATTGIESALINLNIDGEEETVMVKAIQRDPISRSILHTDFLRISLTEVVSTRIPIVAEGSPLGVREEGGILDFSQRDLGIRCLPTDIPQRVELCITVLAVGDSIHVGDIKLPEGFALVDDETTMVLSVRPPILREVVQEEEEELEASEEPEVITRRREEEGAEETA